MPSSSEKQKKFMAAACHDKEFAEKNHIDQEVACEFFEADQKEEQKKKKKESVVEKWSKKL